MWVGSIMTMSSRSDRNCSLVARKFMVKMTPVFIKKQWKVDDRLISWKTTCKVIAVWPSTLFPDEIYTVCKWSKSSGRLFNTAAILIARKLTQA